MTSCDVGSDDVCCQRHHAAADLDASGTAWTREIGLHVYFSILDGILHIHQAPTCISSMIFFLYILMVLHFLRNMYGTETMQATSGVYAMCLRYAHNRWNECVRVPSRDRICLAFEGVVVQEPVDSDRAVRALRQRPLKVSFHTFVIIDNFMPGKAAENIRWRDYDRIA